MPNEDHKNSTVKVEIDVPTDRPVPSAKVAAIPGRTDQIQTTKLATPIHTDDGDITDAVSRIVWTGGQITPGHYQDFTVGLGALPDCTDKLVFKTLQTCGNSTIVRWIDEARYSQPRTRTPGTGPAPDRRDGRGRRHRDPGCRPRRDAEDGRHREREDRPRHADPGGEQQRLDRPRPGRHRPARTPDRPMVPRAYTRGTSPKWWFVRFRDPRQRLRLRIALPDPAAFGPAAIAISIWTAELHQAGLLSEVVYPTSCAETGRWGEGPAWAEAEEVFRADSAAVLAQLAQPALPDRKALLAAHAVAIAAGFTGSTTAGLHWLVDNVPAQAPAAVPRPVFREAVRLADPARDWAALRAEPGGATVVDAWTDRHRALDAYRQHFPGPHTQGVQADDVLGSLLHCSYIRAHRIDFDDEAQVLYLARAAALARLSRDGDQ
ncbi:thiopeptide-type bacteriocin biosynthesis protein [Kitasatospora sp. NPDC048296]|uniref:thiopeptide-type bacteriocin biosynthesis protein n=1 Tax=Kitasatospora sp. NPDC048296 TaxID=3364048 RepID=UPI0037229A06